MWVTLLNRASREHWQEFFELTMVPAPEVYQGHWLLTKVNKSGKMQVRILLLSTERLYNVEVKSGSLAVSKIKWSLPVNTLRAVGTYVHDERAMQLLVKNEKTDAQHVKQEYVFLARNEAERSEVLAEVRRIHYEITDRHLRIEEVQKS